MNWFQFLKLIYEIYGKKTPDLDYIQSLGLLAIKIGQVHALRIDFLGEETTRHLAQLYRRTASLPPEELDELLKSYTSPAWRSNFKSIEKKPFASASVGQVHRAVLVSGEQVAVKIIKKQFRKGFERDVRSIMRFLRVMLFFYPKLRRVADPEGILNHIREYTVEELDLLNEIKGQKALKDIYENYSSAYDLSYLKFIKYYPKLSNRNVLVSQYLDAPTIDEMLEDKTLKYDELLRLFHIHGFYIFKAGVFHGDIHPGNIIVKDGLWFIDHAALGTVSERIRKGLFRFFERLAQDDYTSAARYLNEMAVRRIRGERFRKFERRFLLLYKDFRGASVAQVSLTQKMMQTIKLGVNSGMAFEKGMFSIIKSLMYLDGMVLRCKPDAVLLRDMGPFTKELQGML